MDSGLVALDDAGKEIFTQDEQISRGHSHSALFPPSYYFLKKYRREYREIPEVNRRIRAYEKEYRKNSHYKQWRKQWQRNYWKRTREERNAWARDYYYKNHEKFRAKERQPARRAKNNESKMRAYREIKKDPLKYREYLDKVNARKRRLRAEKKAGTYRDKRLIENKPSL